MSELTLIKAESQLRALGSLFLRKTEAEDVDMNSAEAGGVSFTLNDIADAIRGVIDKGPTPEADTDESIRRVVEKGTDTRETPTQPDTTDDIDLADKVNEGIEYARAVACVVSHMLEGEIPTDPHFNSVITEMFIKLDVAKESSEDLWERLKAAKNNSLTEEAA